jgi:hypothetical protein
VLSLLRRKEDHSIEGDIHSSENERQSCFQAIMGPFRYLQPDYLPCSSTELTEPIRGSGEMAIASLYLSAFFLFASFSVDDVPEFA